MSGSSPAETSASPVTQETVAPDYPALIAQARQEIVTLEALIAQLETSLSGRPSTAAGSAVAGALSASQLPAAGSPVTSNTLPPAATQTLATAARPSHRPDPDDDDAGDR